MSASLAKKNPMRNAYAPNRRPTPAATKKSTRGTAQMAGVMEIDTRSLQRALLWVGGLLTVLLLFLALGFGLIQLYRHCVTSEFFGIAHISINGEKILNEDDILTISGLRQGENILVASIPTIEKRILSNPWVEAVSIRRELPDQFFIDIKERDAVFWVLKDNSIYYLDNNGKLITSVDKSNFKSLPMLDIGPGGEEALPELSSFMHKINSADLPFDLSQISWLKLSAAKGFELYWESKQLSLSIGIEDWNGNLRRMNEVIADMENRKEISQIREIRAADGQVWLQKI